MKTDEAQAKKNRRQRLRYRRCLMNVTSGVLLYNNVRARENHCGP